MPDQRASMQPSKGEYELSVLARLRDIQWTESRGPLAYLPDVNDVCATAPQHGAGLTAVQVQHYGVGATVCRTWL